MLRGVQLPSAGVEALREWGEDSWGPCLWKRNGGEPRQTEVTLRPDPETQLCLPSDDLGPTAMACPRLVKSYVGPWLDLAHSCPLSQAHCCPKPGLF